MILKAFFALILFSPFYLSAQKAHITPVDIYIGDCRPDRPYAIPFTDTIRLYQKDHLVEQIIPKSYKNWPIAGKGLKPGTYRISFPNVFGQRVTRDIVIPDTIAYTIHLPTDELAEYPENSIARLKENESITLSFRESGCFVDFKETLKITKGKAAFIASLHSEKGTKNVQLDSLQLEAFKRFENELEHIKNSGFCTTRDYYTLKLKSKTIEKQDGSCTWNGYYFLKRSFFGRGE